MSKKYSDEEAKARHIARVMAWQKANPEKFKSYTSKYNTKEETREKNRAAYKINREQECARQRAYYAEHKDEILERQREADHKKREDQIMARRKYQKERYWMKKAEKELELATQSATINIKDPTTLGT